MADPPSPRPGDQVVRRARPEPVTVDLAEAEPEPVRLTSPLILVYAFAAIIAVGAVALLLPFASEEPGWTPFMTAFFTSTSAVTVTGLVVVETSSAWTPFGKGVILALIQIGGLGIMTLSAGLFQVLGRRMGLRDQVTLAVESTGRPSAAGALILAKRIAVMVFVVELLGFIALSIRFSFDYPLPDALWNAFFHAISAFNNAGFILLGDDLGGFHTDASFMLVSAVLIILGSISFVVISDMMDNRRRARQMTLDTKLVLSTTFLLWIVGMVVILAAEYANDATFGPLDIPDKLTNSFFESVSGRTAGISASVSDMHHYTWLFLMAMMFIGGASGSTAGGIKVNTLGVLLASALSTIRGRTRTEVFDRQIPTRQVEYAATLAMFGVVVVMALCFVLLVVEDGSPIELIFEAISAFGTNGNSTGVTPTLSTGGQVLIIFAMFLGRVGPLTLALLLAQRRRPVVRYFAQEGVRIG